jgi:hypothetical protein
VQVSGLAAAAAKRRILPVLHCCSAAPQSAAAPQVLPTTRNGAFPRGAQLLQLYRATYIETGVKARSHRVERVLALYRQPARWPRPRRARV